MEPYARALLRFVHAAVAGRQKVEAFALGTRLTRITRELTSRDPDVALRRCRRTGRPTGAAAHASASGLRQFNDEWGVRGLARNSIVVILSDGWDRGDPELWRRDGAPAARDPSTGVGQSAQGHARLRAPGQGNGGGAAVC